VAGRGQLPAAQQPARTLPQLGQPELTGARGMDFGLEPASVTMRTTWDREALPSERTHIGPTKIEIQRGGVAA